MEKLDSNALGVLLPHHRRFLRFLRTRVESDTAAEDILQTAYLKAVESVSTIRDEESILAWFYRVLRNAVVDYYRRRGTESRALETFGNELATTVEPEIRGQLCACLHDALDDVKEDYRRAVQQVDLDEVPVAEFARREAISTNNAFVRLHRARRAVKEHLARVCGVCADHACLDCGCRREM